MRINKRWYKLKTIVPALLVLPPLGLFLLWISPKRTRKAKIAITLVFVLLLAGTGAAIIATGYYKNWQEPPVPESGFDVFRTDRGAYRIARVLPFERDIFDEVVKELRKIQKRDGMSYAQTEASEIDDPVAMAVAIVAERHGLDAIDVQAIYTKVSSKLAPRK